MPNSGVFPHGAGILVFGKAHVVHVGFAADGVEKPDLIAHLVQQLDVVGDHDEPALVLGQEITQPRDGIGVEVVGGLVEKQRRRGLARAIVGGEENLRELNTTTLAAGKRFELLVEDAVRQTQVVTNLGCFGICLITTEGLEALLETGVFRDRGVALGPVLDLHNLLLTFHRGTELVEPAGREHTVARSLLNISLAGILWQVANLTGACHRPAVRLGLPRQDAHRGRFASTVAADEPDAVAGLHA